MAGTNSASPSDRFAAVSKSDTVNYTVAGEIVYARGLYVGGAGDVILVGSDNVAVTFSSVPAGTILPCLHKRVNNSTTATNMVALF